MTAQTNGRKTNRLNGDKTAQHDTGSSTNATDL